MAFPSQQLNDYYTHQRINIHTMKNILFYLIMVLFISSCGNGDQNTDSIIASGDLEKIRSQKSEISNQKKILEDEIALLDSVIKAMDPDKNLPLVTTIEVKEQQFRHYLELQGGVETKQNVLIYPEMPGTLQGVYVKEGQRVKKGQLLATIDDGGISSQLAQLKTQAQLAKTTYERQARLWEQKIGSEMQYLQAKANYEATENTVKQVQSQLGRSSIVAPFSGIIDDVIKDQGTVVSPGPGSEVFRIINLTDMYINVDVPERYLKGVQKGNEAQVYFPVLGDTITTKIRETGNFINPGNRAFNVEIPVPNTDGNIKPNLTAKVRLNDYTNDKAILIPQSIISENAEGQQYVFVAEKTGTENEGQVKKHIIVTGKTQGNIIEILSGIAVGDKLIKEGARSVKEGQNVEILKD